MCNLFSDYDTSGKLKQKYIKLLEKFEVALTLNENQVLIPSLMPKEATFPKPNDRVPGDVSELISYQPSFRRFWMSNFVPDGFWPRLICRIATDQQIGKVHCVYNVHVYTYIYMYMYIIIYMYIHMYTSIQTIIIMCACKTLQFTKERKQEKK